MQTVTFAREFRYPLGNNREARYPPNVEIEVTDAVVTAARKAGALKKEEKPRAKRPAATD
ncbi:MULTISPECIES: hypothetical protein [unclassified Novosphingobium]|uniref:hypothetical protein n=1 Tax=unclassified Novosphingobium TaxID=2644732 RepID=UPI0006C8BB3D|nr:MULTISPECIES: hypothetical protein [unclassified Novosphingobium]KPH66047.1 hypothetical protein ADT71_08775 [Novosphingobium sp. ST904]TCM33798.1 hypothetical protein EDF59_119114 [Novosphingobium sp. ST904]WRT91917.1 hypothetical protein U9J33_11920 [Novosphingobium sp. RL4]WRT95900.1 hypothetical protein U9J33_20075 [Novosphingobium sp. RL4]